jgi:hypothetical protein
MAAGGGLASAGDAVAAVLLSGHEVTKMVVLGAAMAAGAAVVCGGAAVVCGGGAGTAAAVPFCSSALALKASCDFSALGLMENTMPLPQWLPVFCLQ